jgi:hypothetical protein
VKDLNFIYLTKSRNLMPGLLALLQALARSRFGSFSRIDKARIQTERSSWSSMWSNSSSFRA